MFTSRAEYRTLLRQDNADIRLTPKSFALGLADKDRMQRVEEKIKKSQDFHDFFQKTSFTPTEVNPILERLDSEPVRQGAKMVKVFSRPKVTMDHMLELESVRDYVNTRNIDREIQEQTEIQVKYAGYIEKEIRNADKLQRLEHIEIPENFDYSKLKSLSFEAREKLTRIQPTTVAQASRISGVSPSDISVLLIFMGR